MHLQEDDFLELSKHWMGANIDELIKSFGFSCVAGIMQVMFKQRK